RRDSRAQHQLARESVAAPIPTAAERRGDSAVSISFILRACAVAALTASVTGCTGLFHSDARPEQVYYLRASPVPQGTAPVAASLRLNRPTASPGLEGTQIVLLQSDRRMSFFEAARWPAAPANMVEMLTVEKLRGSGLWQSVADSGSPFPSDYVLLVSVRRFEADYTAGNV